MCARAEWAERRARDILRSFTPAGGDLSSRPQREFAIPKRACTFADAHASAPAGQVDGNTPRILYTHIMHIIMLLDESCGRGGRIEVYLHGQACALVGDADDREIDYLTRGARLGALTRGARLGALTRGARLGAFKIRAAARNEPDGLCVTRGGLVVVVTRGAVYR